MKILVTGGAGFIGSHTVDLLLEKGYEVRILDSLEPPVHPKGETPSYMPKEAEFIRGDVRNKVDMDRALKDIDAVIHLAAYQDYLTDFSKFFHVNTVGTALLYEVIVEKSYPIQKVVVASSQATYGEAKYRCFEHGEVYPPLRPVEQLERGNWEPKCPECGAEIVPLKTDEAKVNPHNQYAMSKYSQELVSLNLGKRYGIPTVAMRYSITQGPRQSFFNAYSGICRIFTTRLLNNRPPIAYEDGAQLRDYVYIGDVAKANLLVLQKEEANYQVFNVGGDRTTSVLAYAYLLAKKTGKAIEPEVPGIFRFGDTRHVFSDVSKLRTLGWSPEASLEKIAEKYIAWASAQPEIKKDHYADAQEKMIKSGTLRRISG